MHKIDRLLINICAADINISKKFYIDLFDFTVDYESDWFIHLKSEDNSLELGLIDRNNEIVPESIRNNPTGFYLTFVVENVMVVHKMAERDGFSILEQPHHTKYGQKRMLLKDPDGTVIDVSSPIEN